MSFFGAYEYDPDPTHIRSALIPSSQNRYDLTHTRTALQNEGELPMVNMNIMQLLAATAVGYGLAYAVRGINTGDWSIPMTADAVMEGAQRGLPIAAVYVGGVIVGRNWGAAEEPDLDIDIDLAGLALDNTGENFPEFQALLVEWYDSTLSRDERIHLARSLVRLMDHYGISNLVAHTALTPSMARSLYDFASAHGYGGLALDNVG